MSVTAAQSTIANLIRFLVASLATVIGTHLGRADLGAFIAFLMIAMHFRTHPTLLAEYKTVTVVLVIGSLWELFLIRAHLISYEGNVSFSPVPMWVVTFWAALGTTFNGCLSWGKSHLFLISILAALTGSLLSYGGSVLGIFHLKDPLITCLIIGSGWASLAAILFLVAGYFFRTSEAIKRN